MAVTDKQTQYFRYARSSMPTETSQLLTLMIGYLDNEEYEYCLGISRRIPSKIHNRNYYVPRILEIFIPGFILVFFPKFKVKVLTGFPLSVLLEISSGILSGIPPKIFQGLLPRIPASSMIPS